LVIANLTNTYILQGHLKMTENQVTISVKIVDMYIQRDQLPGQKKPISINVR